MTSMRNTRFLIAALLITVSTSAALPARAAELLMFEEKWCHWCARWNEEIGGIYDKTDEGALAPLRRVDIHDGVPPGIVLDRRPQYTPTFVLVDDGREIGRIEGHPGEDFFWGLLGQLLRKLPQTDPAQRPNTNS